MELTRDAMFMIAQVVGALLLIVILIAFVNNALSGGLLAQRIYPVHFGTLATVVGQSQDAMVMGDFVKSFESTNFSFSGRDNQIDVRSSTLRLVRKFWMFTPAAVALQSFDLDPATGVVHVFKEDGQLRFSKNPDFYYNLRTCPVVDTADKNGLGLRHVFDRDIGDSALHKGMDDIVKLLTAELTSSIGPASDSAERFELMDKATGVIVRLSIDSELDKNNRVVAYYNADADKAVQRKSAKLGCLVVNELQSAFGIVQGTAFVPSISTSLPDDKPGIVLVVAQQGALKHLIDTPLKVQKAIRTALEGYYSG